MASVYQPVGIRPEYEFVIALVWSLISAFLECSVTVHSTSGIDISGTENLCLSGVLNSCKKLGVRT